MYTIMMYPDKSLVATNRTTIFQREKLADKIQFLFSQSYGDINTRDCMAVLKYVDQGNVAHAEILNMDKELYKDRIRCVLPIDTDLTRFAGDIYLRITFIKLNTSKGVQEEVLHSGETSITIAPLSDYYAFVGDESLELIDKTLAEAQAKIEATKILAESIDENKAEDFLYENGDFTLLGKNRKKIGHTQAISSGVTGEYDVVEFDKVTPEPDEPEMDDKDYDVVEF